MRFLALLFGQNIYYLFSFIVKLIFKLRGIKVGKNFYVEQTPLLRILGKANNIQIGDNVKFVGQVELKVRENGKIVIEDNCKIDQNVRLIAANDALLKIGRNTGVGAYSIFNCGTDVIIGEKTLISGFVYLQSSNHGMDKGSFIKDQKHSYGEINIGDDVWLASHVSVLPGVTIGKGAVVGSKAVVNKDVNDYEIVAGVPARCIGQRK